MIHSVSHQRWMLVFAFGTALLLTFAFSRSTRAQDEEPPPEPPPVNNNDDYDTPKTNTGSGEIIEVEPEDEDGYADAVVYTDKEIKAECNKYRGKYVSYYDHVYLVENCKLRELMTEKRIQLVSKARARIYEVDGTTLAKLGLGTPITDDGSKEKVRGCKELENRYVTITYTDIYFVTGCKKRPFPDWETYMDHRKAKKKVKEEVLAVSLKEFDSLKLGPEITSVIDAEFAKVLTGEAGIEVIPVDEACRGLNGKDVSYVDKLYRIEKCRKREYDPELYLKKRRNVKIVLKELTAEQWLSLPDGKSMDPVVVVPEAAPAEYKAKRGAP